MKPSSRLVVLLVVLLAVSASGAMFAQEQIVTPNPVAQDAVANQPVSIVMEYSTNPAGTPLTGLQLGIYFDSSLLNYVSLSDTLADGFAAVGPPQLDGADGDGDASTDARVPILWSAPTATWPAVNPTALVTINFTTAAAFAGSTQVNLVAVAVDGWESVTTPATISLRMEPDPPVQPVPTLSEWGLILMFLLLVGAGLWAMKRRDVGN